MNSSTLIETLDNTQSGALSFGALKIKRNNVEQFQEKTNIFDSWINGGFFIFKSKILKYIKKDSTYLEKEPLQKIAKLKEMVAYKHFGFWHCMDTLRDKNTLIDLWNSENPPWKVW